MGGVPAKHHSKSKVGRRRSNLGLKPKKLSVCLKCGHPVLSHRICPSCGVYKGKIVREPKIKVKSK